MPSPLMPAAVDQDADVAAARRRLHDVLDIADPTTALWHLVGDRFFERWIPEITELQMAQDPVHRHKDVLSHTIAVTAKTPAEPIVRMAALLHDIGKPATRRIRPDGVTFRHHEAVGARIALRRLRSMQFDERYVTDVARLVELSGRFKGYADGWTDAAVRRYARDAGHLLGALNELVRCDCTTHDASKVAALRRDVDDLERRLRSLAAEERRAAERPPLDGEDVMALLRIGPGPDVGAALALLLDHQHRGGHSTNATPSNCSGDGGTSARRRPGWPHTMNDWLDRNLATSQFLDCHGHVTHTLTLMPDGMVRVTAGSRAVTVDPQHRSVTPPGAQLPQEVIDFACSFARDAFG